LAICVTGAADAAGAAGDVDIWEVAVFAKAVSALVHNPNEVAQPDCKRDDVHEIAQVSNDVK
jgi:hypothetical protein